MNLKVLLASTRLIEFNRLESDLNAYVWGFACFTFWLIICVDAFWVFQRIIQEEKYLHFSLYNWICLTHGFRKLTNFISYDILCLVKFIVGIFLSILFLSILVFLIECIQSSINYKSHSIICWSFTKDLESLWQ